LRNQQFTDLSVGMNVSIPTDLPTNLHQNHISNHHAVQNDEDLELLLDLKYKKRHLCVQGNTRTSGHTQKENSEVAINGPYHAPVLPMNLVSPIVDVCESQR
jgi:hypothetical protein